MNSRSPTNQSQCQSRPTLAPARPARAGGNLDVPLLRLRRPESSRAERGESGRAGADSAAVGGNLRCGGKKDFDRLDSYHAYGPQFTKFGETLGRLDAAAARQGEHEGLAAVQGLRLEPEELKIDLVGNVGIATMILKASLQNAGTQIEKRSRATLVFVQETNAWKIIHEHFSPLILNH